MNRIIFLLAVLTFASCSRIVTKDYELLDSGTVAEIDNVEGKIGIASNRDGVCREWFPETMRDGLSVWGICYADSLAVGDKCYVYDGGDKPVISKVSVADAQRINRALCRQYWKELLISERLIVCVLMALATMAFWLFSPNSGKCIGVGFVLILATTAAAVAWMAPGRKLEKVGSGVITGVEKKRFTLDGKTVYYLSLPKDVFNGETLEAGKAVNVYRYGKHRSGIRENIFLSRSSFNEATLKKAQIYPEIFLKTVGLYWGLLLVSGGVILPFWAGREKLRRKKTQQRGGAEQR